MNEIYRWIILFYFVTHIPITLFIDLQGLLPKQIYEPSGLANFNDWYVNSFDDHLMKDTPLWLQSFLCAEMLLQFPFFFVAVYSLWYKINYARIGFVIYGAHTSTTLLPILSEFIITKKYTLFCIYLPYLIIPLSLMIYFALYEEAFESKRKAR
jgi:hypothetical protein